MLMPYNGFVERLHRTLLDEHFRVMGRKKWYESIDEIQKDLETYLHHYNHDRPHEGRNMKGMTPCQAFTDGIVKAEKGTTKKLKKAA
jgi:transposase InsO family protein